ncbi:MFS general substrate transporter, partial [Phlebopus sp. FC_14]
LSTPRKIFLLALFCFAQFLDTFNTSALFSAIPAIAVAVGLNNSQSVWLNSAYQLTFAAFLLISGRMSDVYNPKIVFLAGVYPLAFLAIGTGFVRNKIAILVLRALSGIGTASLTIPSSLHLLVHMFPEPVAQAKAVSAFAGSGALGNVLGVVIGALFISYATWPWVFWMVAIVAMIIAASCTILIPNPGYKKVGSSMDRFRRLDVSGGSILTIALVLFIFAVTSGSTDSWVTATVLAPLILSVFLFTSYFVWESRIAEEHASLPPKMWSYPNFTVLALLALLPYSWWSTVYLLFAWYWQEVLEWSAISSAVHFLPIGLFAFPFMALSGVLQQKVPIKYIFLIGLTFMLGGTVFFPFADSAGRYWPIVFPGFLLGTAGTTLVFATTNIAIFAVTPPEVAGTVGAVFNCALQLGTAVFSAATTSIQTTVQTSPTAYNGRAAGFEFLVAYVAVQMLSVLIFFKNVPMATVALPPQMEKDINSSESAIGSREEHTT